MRLKISIPKKKLSLGQLDRVTQGGEGLTQVMRLVPHLMRFGEGSLDQQIRQRTHFTPEGGRQPWIEPDHMSSPATFSNHELLEDIMWQAVRAHGPGSITNYGKQSATVGVNDQVIRVRSAQLGNQIVSNAPYFGFVTGDFQERRSAAKAKPAKPTAKGKGKFPRNTAMWWYLKFNFNYEASPEEMEAGLSVPPKNLGFNPTMLERIRSLITRFIITGKV